MPHGAMTPCASHGCWPVRDPGSATRFDPCADGNDFPRSRSLVSWALALALGSRVVAQEDAEVYGSGLIQPATPARFRPGALRGSDEARAVLASSVPSHPCVLTVGHARVSGQSSPRHLRGGLARGWVSAYGGYEAWQMAAGDSFDAVFGTSQLAGSRRRGR